MTRLESADDDRMQRLADAEALIRSRRTSLLVERERGIPPEMVERLCALVGMAPNHKRTRPWQVAVFTEDGRLALGRAFAADVLARSRATGVLVPDAKMHKLESKYGRAPVIIVVGTYPVDDPIRHREDLYAVAAGVQNLLLGTAAAGLAAMWSSPPTAVAFEVNRLVGFAEGSELVAVVYLGYPSACPPDLVRQPIVARWCSSRDGLTNTNGSAGCDSE